MQYTNHKCKIVVAVIEGCWWLDNMMTYVKIQNTSKTVLKSHLVMHIDYYYMRKMYCKACYDYNFIIVVTDFINHRELHVITY